MKSDERANRAKLISVVQAIVKESGEPRDFDAAAWIDDWSKQALPALGGKTPADYLHTHEGCDLLIRLLRQMQAGVFV
ncbi:MAG: hypothetical protein RSP_12000 [Rhodanobacter sp.]